MKRMLILLVLTFLWGGPAEAQRRDPESPFLLNVDYSRFRNNDTTGYVELYFLFYPGLVTTVPDAGGTLRGSILIRVRAADSTSGAIFVNEIRVVPVALRDSAEMSSTNTLVTQAGYVLPFGAYAFSVTAIDSLNPSRRDSLSLVIPLTGLTPATSVSDLQLCSRISQGTPGTAFYKNTLEVVPNATLMFGVTSHPVVFHYLELYNLQQSRRYALATSVLDASGTQLRLTTRMRDFSISDAVDVGTMNVTSLPSGRYIYQISVLEDSLREVARTRKVFYVFNPHVKTEQLSAASLKANELAGLTFDELGDEFEMAKYLATPADVTAFPKLTTAEARRVFMSEFWATVESGKSGKDPVARVDYLRRSQQANTRYRTQGRPGWRTDRGRVFLLFGEPDEIERVPSDEYGKPHEIWYYYQIENGVQFVFLDRTGFGDYILVHSTKRGELRDDTWQRQLR